MTRVEALDWIKARKEHYELDDNCQQLAEALNMAIKALEQEPVLDKIRAEIEGYKSTIDNAISEDELKIEGMKEAYADLVDIIDKYKVEMRGNEE